MALWASCLCIFLGEGRGVALIHVYVSEHKVSPYYRTAWRMFMKLGRDEVFMAPHMHQGVLTRSTQGRIQGRAKVGDGGLLQQSAFSDWKATSTNQMYSNDLEAYGMKCCYFVFHSEVNFLCVHCSQVSDSGLLGLLFQSMHRVSICLLSERGTLLDLL